MSASTSTPRTCSDCGQPSPTFMTVRDPLSHSELKLCPFCSLAFVQRQHFSPGCCD